MRQFKEVFDVVYFWILRAILVSKIIFDYWRHRQMSSLLINDPGKRRMKKLDLFLDSNFSHVSFCSVRSTLSIQKLHHVDHRSNSLLSHAPELKIRATKYHTAKHPPVPFDPLQRLCWAILGEDFHSMLYDVIGLHLSNDNIYTDQTQLLLFLRCQWPWIRSYLKSHKWPKFEKLADVRSAHIRRL